MRSIVRCGDIDFQRGSRLDVSFVSIHATERKSIVASDRVNVDRIED